MSKESWTREGIRAVYDLPLMELVLKAQDVHRQHHDPSEIHCAKLISVKTGGCSEDCHYCAQAARYHTNVGAQPMMPLDEVKKMAEEAKANGCTRICLSAAWRQPRDGAAFDRIVEMVGVVRGMDLEVCCTLGMMSDAQIAKLKEAGIYAINHNIDTSGENYDKIITTRSFQDRLDTLERVRKAGVSQCCGGIIGMGESVNDRLSMLLTISQMDPVPDSVPINQLEPIPGTPMEGRPKISFWEFLRMIATTRIVLPKSMVRLSAGRRNMAVSQQALCFIAGANSLHVGNKLLTVPNPEHDVDTEMLRTLGLKERPAFKPTTITSDDHTLDPLSLDMEQELNKRSKQSNLRHLRHTEELVDLTSNDYLGFARSKELAQEVHDRFEDLSEDGGIRPLVGATGSRLLTGNSAYIENLESYIASFHGAEAGILFNSGYVANLGLLGTCIKYSDTIILDAQVHASTWEGARLSGARQMLFRHNDPKHLDKQLKKASGRCFVCIESLYSMSGDIAPLKDIVDVCTKHGAYLIVDEAHATGIFGEQGRGIVCANDLEDKIFARVHTFGKALGTHGAIVLGSKTLRDYLINFSRPLIYTTAFPLHTQVSIQCAYEHLKHADRAQQQLQSLIQYFHRLVKDSDLPVVTTQTPIQSIRVGDADKAKRFSEALAKEGLDVRAITRPTVRRGQECLRICLHAFNTKEELSHLVSTLKHLWAPQTYATAMSTTRDIIGVAGIGTEVGKTVVSSILVEALGADYWKPIQCGELQQTDTMSVQNLVSRQDIKFHREAHALASPLAPQEAAHAEGRVLDPQSIKFPSTNGPLVVEMAGGILVPVDGKATLLDILSPEVTRWVIVSKHYLGSINHTLATVETLQRRKLPIWGIVFNGKPNPHSEEAILTHTGLPCLGHIHDECCIDKDVIKRYAELWKSPLVEHQSAS